MTHQSAGLNHLARMQTDTALIVFQHAQKKTPAAKSKMNNGNDIFKNSFMYNSNLEKIFILVLN